jgi:hypothetical protein
MKGTTFYLILLLVLGYSTVAFAQQRQEEEDNYTREFVWGINKNTNGGYIGGINAKFTRRLQGETFRSLGIEIANVKHPEEARVTSIYGGGYIMGKSNYLYAIRFSYGLERLLFRKAPQQGVQVSVLASGGPTLGIIAPYYIEYGTGGLVTSEQYDPSNSYHTQNYIHGSGRPLEGITESSFTAGLHVRSGLSFEFGTFKSNVSGLEIGLMLEAFPGDIVLLPRSENRSIFPSAYVTLFHGSRR